MPAPAYFSFIPHIRHALAWTLGREGLRIASRRQLTVMRGQIALLANGSPAYQ